MLPSPNFNQNYGGAALLGEGINQGVNNFMQNYLGMKRQKTAQQYADIYGRQQAVQEGELQAQNSPMAHQQGQPVADTASSTAVPATLVGNYAGMGEQLPQAAAPGGAAPPYQGMGEVLPQGTQLQGNVGAQALATQPAQVQPATPQAGPQPVGEMSLDQLREMAFGAGQHYRQNAMENQNDMEMLQKAYHYNTVLQTGKPYLDKWHEALNKVRANPNDPTAYRNLQVLTGEEDPDKAFAMGVNEYAKLRQDYDQNQKSFAPLNQHLSSRGITPDQYGDEAKYVQLLNQRQFQPHTAAQMPGARMRSPSMSGRR